MAATLVIVVGFTNLLVHRYAQAVIRQATDEGARAWAVAGGSQADCHAKADSVLSDLLGGTIINSVTIECVDTGQTITATATAELAGMPPAPGSTFATTSVATKELHGAMAGF